MPSAVDTGAMPDFSKAFLPHQMTLKSNLLNGYDKFLEDGDATGQIVEAAHDHLFDWGHPGYKSGKFAERTEAVFEPWFERMHGERSGLPGAISNWPEREPKADISC